MLFEGGTSWGGGLTLSTSRGQGGPRSWGPRWRSNESDVADIDGFRQQNQKGNIYLVSCSTVDVLTGSISSSQPAHGHGAVTVSLTPVYY